MQKLPLSNFPVQVAVNALAICISTAEFQYCQTRSVNILTWVCRELTRLSISKHTLVNILTIGQLEHPQMTLDDPPFLDHRKLKLACRNMIVKKKSKKLIR